jgi:hypothetical protein
MATEDNDHGDTESEFEEFCVAFDDAVARAVEGSREALAEVVELGAVLAEFFDGQEDSAEFAQVRFMQGLAHVDLHEHAVADGEQADGDHDCDEAVEAFRDVRARSADEQLTIDAALRLGLVLSYRILRNGAWEPGELDEAIDALMAGQPAAVESEAAIERLRFYRLGLLRAARYLGAGGDAADHAEAERDLTAILADPAISTDTANATRLFLAQLAMGKVLPPELRTGSANISHEAVAAVRDGTLGADIGARIGAVLEQLDAVSPEITTGPLASVVGGMRAMAKITAVRDGAAMAPEDLRAAAELVTEMQRETEPASPGSALLTATEVALSTQLSRLTKTAPESGAVVDDLLEALGQVEGHPLEPMFRDLLGEIAPTHSRDRLTAGGDLDSTIAQLERVLTELTDHPARIRALCALAVAAVLSAIKQKSTVALTKIRAILTAAQERTATSATDDGVLAVIAAWTDGLHAAFTHDTALMNEAIARIQEAAGRLPPDHELQAMLGPQIAALLAQRFMITRDLGDLAALRSFGTLESAATEKTAWMFKGLSVIQALADPAGLTGAKIDELLADLDDAIELMPEEQAGIYDWGRLRPALEMIRSSVLGEHPGFPPPGPAQDAFVAAADAMASPSGTDLLGSGSEGAMALLGSGIALWDRTRVDRAVAMLTRECLQPTDILGERLVLLSSLGFALRARHGHWRRPKDLDDAIVRLEEGRRLAFGEPGLADTAALFNTLGESYHARGDRARHDHTRAVEAGLDGLRARMQDVLVQHDPAHALSTALRAEGEAVTVARWCVDAGDVPSAVRALELGRAMVLHSATVEAGAAELLRAAGHTGLAERWAAQPGEPVPAVGLPDFLPPTGIPDTLRREVLIAIEGTETERHLLSPPTVADISATLDRVGATALVYLVPRDEGAGYAVIVPDSGPARELPLPHLAVTRNGPIDLFERAQRDLQRLDPATPEGEHARQRWDDVVGKVSTWAWNVAIGPVFDTVPAPRGPGVARWVLAPVGRLSGVPWHAAGRLVGEGVRYACQDAIITYAASARQFTDACGRGARRWRDAPALAAAAEDLTWSWEEIQELQHFYPGADLGDGGAPGPEQVLARLPREGSAGASVLHLSCHARRADPPIDSYLVLADGTPLPVRRILRQAASRPAGQAGALVVLAACVSDLTDSSPDEALTLATAFLAGGAAGVLGTRWPVDDRQTALFMVMFHHYLNSGYPEPPTAMRAAQMWMLDPDRRLPKWISGLMAGEERRPGLETIGAWAAFTYQGL